MNLVTILYILSLNLLPIRGIILLFLHLGTYQGLTLEVGASLQRMNLGMKFLFEVKHLSVSTACGIHKNDHEQLRDVPAPRFRSSKSVDIPSESEIQEYLPFIEADNMLTYGHDAPSSSTSALGSSTGNTSMEFSLHQCYILKHFSSHLKTEKKYWMKIPVWHI